MENVKRYVAAFGRDHDLTLFLVNIPADTPSEHVHAAVAGSSRYGRLPLAEDLDEVPFEIPQPGVASRSTWTKMSGGKGLQY